MSTSKREDEDFKESVDDDCKLSGEDEGDDEGEACISVNLLRVFERPRGTLRLPFVSKALSQSEFKSEKCSAEIVGNFFSISLLSVFEVGTTVRELDDESEGKEMSGNSRWGFLEMG
eukprot:Lithocolla_globosa_v1_NODE_1006_length_2961_cov_5.322092.p2 type:complete len:117 gc:universal NODE_1006_length_2961_cov_5.322092:1722-2072(+)